MENNYTIFKLLNENDNDKISDFKGYELNEILFYINKFLLKYRSKLNADSINFGCEIEFEETNLHAVEHDLGFYTFNLNNWNIKSDMTLINGGEIATPILSNNKECFEDLKKICEIVYKYSKNLDNCSSHIHIDANYLGSKKNTWSNLFKLWVIFEDVIYRFLYGEFLTERKSIKLYARPISNILVKQVTELENIELYKVISNLKDSRNMAINFQNVLDFYDFYEKNTLEFRVPNGTFDHIILQNNINFILHLVKFCKSDNFNYEYINYLFNNKINNMSNDINILDYRKIYLEKAICLCDLIFDTNIDKIYFLRQYIKNFDIGKTTLEKAKTFTLK